MKPSRNEHSIAVSCSVHGRGYWSGSPVQVVMHPAPVGTGLRLVRTDIQSRPECQVCCQNRIDAQLRTNLRSGDANFQMVEHLLAALYALEIDNCFVEIDAEELPGLDGSSAEYVRALQNAGLIVQASTRRRLIVDRVIRIESEDRWIQAEPAHDGETFFEYRLSFDSPGPIAEQTYGTTLQPSCFAREIAAARTFVTESQANQLRQQGVGGHVSNRDLLVFGKDGPIGNVLRFQDECARHKTLDMIGDLAVTGLDLVGRFVSHRGGHSLNGQMAATLWNLATGSNTEQRPNHSGHEDPQSHAA